MSRNDIESTLSEYIGRELIGRHGEPPGADDDLLGSGLLDSLAVMRLVRFLEDTWGVKVPPADVTIEHFMTVGTVAAYLETLPRESPNRDDAVAHA